MLEDCYLCECNIEWAHKLKERAWHTIYVDVASSSRVLRESFLIARCNDVIQYNSIMMLTHGDFDYAE